MQEITPEMRSEIDAGAAGGAYLEFPLTGRQVCSDCRTGGRDGAGFLGRQVRLGVISEVNRLKAKVQPIAGLRTDLDVLEAVQQVDRCGGEPEERSGRGVDRGLADLQGVWIHWN